MQPVDAGAGTEDQGRAQLVQDGGDGGPCVEPGSVSGTLC